MIYFEAIASNISVVFGILLYRDIVFSGLTRALPELITDTSEHIHFHF